MRSRGTARGTATLEMVIVAPLLLAVMSMIFAFGRYAQTESLVDQAARDAARAATAQNSRGEAQQIAQDVAREALASAPESCRDSHIVLFSDTADAFGLADLDNLAAVESVTVRVDCELDLSDLAALPIGVAPVSQAFTSPLDRYRGYRD